MRVFKLIKRYPSLPKSWTMGYTLENKRLFSLKDIVFVVGCNEVFRRMAESRLK